ncbi:hypothetical protein AX17_003556 [Amanita inopinata Kibby_2008]|nr:hypothetical protein AX17_003556 [Amanita inopinata Kibby_2008]
MSLDQNLFTLHFTQGNDDPNVIDLVDPSGTVHYHRRRISGQTYKIEVYDPTSKALLATASSPASNSKHKTIELHNPSTVVELRYTGTLSFRWTFKWEEHEFEWKREECYIVRKPDPPVLVAVTKEPTGRLKTMSVQVLDYNINRFDINDRKGLEIVILTALLTFQDYNEVHQARNESSSPKGLAKGKKSPGNLVNLATSSPSSAIPVASPLANLPPAIELTPPPPPPKPAPKTGIDRIAEMQALRGEINEVVVEDQGTVRDYAQYCFNLLQDDAMLFITVKSTTAQQVPKVLQVVEETKRLRYKTGLSEDEELHQYVLYDTEVRKGPRRINLDDDSKRKAKYAPPNSLTVHLSKIPMPELQPTANVNDKKESRKTEVSEAGKHSRFDNNASGQASSSTSSVLSRRRRSFPSPLQANLSPHNFPTPTTDHARNRATSASSHRIPDARTPTPSLTTTGSDRVQPGLPPSAMARPGYHTHNNPSQGTQGYPASQSTYHASPPSGATPPKPPTGVSSLLGILRW